MLNIGLEHKNIELDSMEQNNVSTIDCFDMLDAIIEEHQIFDSIEKLEFIRDYVSQNGITDTISAMIDGQLSCASKEELLDQIEVALEGLISKITGDTLDNTIKQCAKLITAMRYEITHSDWRPDPNKVYHFFTVEQIEQAHNAIAEMFEKFAMISKCDVLHPSEGIKEMIANQSSFSNKVKDLIRNLKPIEMHYDEYKKSVNNWKDGIDKYNTVISHLKFGKLLSMGKASTADIINKTVDNGLAMNKRARKDAGQVVEAAESASINKKLNMIIRMYLRWLRVVLMKFQAIILKNNNDSKNLKNFIRMNESNYRA